MGLLDDAIREHLDLKRARGGDPAEIEKMEREALGPVRREPTIGSARAELLDEQLAIPHDPEFHGEHLTDLEELQEQGYNDSTAPHPHAHHEAHHSPAGEHLDFEQHDVGDPFIEEAEQPRRRFLRRNRSSAEPTLPDHSYDDEPFDPLGHHEHVEHHEPLAHAEPEFDPLEHHEPRAQAEPEFDPLAHAAPEHGHREPTAEHEAEPPIAHGQPLHDEFTDQPTGQEPAASHTPPPHLQFDHPPKRPRFSAEPPELHEDAPAEPELEAGPAGLSPAEEEVEAQETTEFDVQRHIAETRHQAEESLSAPEAPARPAPPTPPAQPAPPVAAEPEDEDVLEETPEFLQDTPEHDRLWFEQRPPKDFDFDG